jgi:hypothetical protein
LLYSAIVSSLLTGMVAIVLGLMLVFRNPVADPQPGQETGVLRKAIAK